MIDLLKNYKILIFLKNFFDILIISYIIYKIITLLKGTRAIQVFKGFFILIITTILARLLHLSTLTWILEIFWNVWIIATVVIFQPELRTAFAEMGKGHKTNIFVMDEILNEIVDAVIEMSKTKTGALIAIERNVGLREYVSTGVILNSKITRQLIETIFFKNSFLHDGGIIIQNSLITAAGCFFPMTEKENLPSAYGARHRAALGLSEASDSLILLVSEETGDIEIIIEKEIFKVSKKGEIFGLLYEKLGISEKDKNPILNFFSHDFSIEKLKQNIFLKMSSFTFGIILWYIVKYYLQRTK